MDVVFKNRRLAKAETDEWQKCGVNADPIEPLRRRLHVIRNAPDERTLRNWRSLHFEKLSGDMAGFWSIRIRNGWRLIFQLETTPTKQRQITIHDVVDYH